LMLPSTMTIYGIISLVSVKNPLLKDLGSQLFTEALVFQL
jgi:hypothetical protein